MILILFCTQMTRCALYEKKSFRGYIKIKRIRNKTKTIKKKLSYLPQNRKSTQLRHLQFVLKYWLRTRDTQRTNINNQQNNKKKIKIKKLR